MSYTSWLLRNRFVVLLATAACAAAGVVAWRALPIDAFPDVTNMQVMILTKAPGLSAIDVEQRVSWPIEKSMRGLPRVADVRSLSRAELSQVVVVFEDDAETYWTRQVVFERLSRAGEDLPAGVEPEMGPISTGLGEIFQYTLSSDRHDAMELRTIQDWMVAPLLEPVPGVNEVNSFGGHVREYQVVLDPGRLLGHRLAASEVVEAIERNSGNAAGGVVVHGWEQTYLRGVGLATGIGDIERIVLTERDGTPVYVRDVARVEVGPGTRQGAVTRDAKGETVAGMVIMLKGENSREVVARVKRATTKIRSTLPAGVTLDVYYDRTSLIEACIATVLEALLEGGVLVIFVLFLFAAELRTALVVLVSLPLTFLATFIVMGRIGLTSNLMSLGGLAFSVGMVVDASIVVVENVRRHLAAGPDGRGKLEIVAAAVQEVARPVAFSVLVIAIILVPLFSLQGIEGKMFAPLALTMLIALLMSLAVALTSIPALCSVALMKAPERVFRPVRLVHAGYLAVLRRALASPRATLGVSGLVLVSSITLVPLVGTEFMPPLDEGAIAVNVVRLPNASLEGSIEVAGFIEKRLLRFREVATVVSKTGRAEISEDPMGPEQTDVLVMLKPRSEWRSGRSKAELVEAMQEDLSRIPGLRLSFSQPIALRVNELISGVKSDLAVKVFGADLEVLRERAAGISALVREVDGAEDVKVEQVTGMDQYDVVLDRTSLARHGIDVATVNGTIETAIAGRRAGTVIEGERRAPIVVRFPQASRESIDDIGRLLVAAPGGERVRLDQLAAIRLVDSPAQVSRENGMRRIVVEANVRGRDLGRFVADVRKVLAPLERGLPPGYFLEYGGQFENQERAMRRLAVVVPASLAIVMVLLYLALGSIRRSLLVLVNLPFALVGGVVAIVIFRMPLSVSAAVAFIVLIGVAVQNGVVLVAFFRQLRKSGLSVEETVRAGCDLRFRPLLMTALTSFIGHVPMLFATGSGADIQKPLAVVVMGGLVTSTILTLLVLPTLYSLLARTRLRPGSVK